MERPEGMVDLPRVTRTGVQPGDQVIIAVYTGAGSELREASGERIVDPSGEIFLPFLSTVRVIGMETADIRRLLEERYGEIYAQVVVEVVVNVKINITARSEHPASSSSRRRRLWSTPCHAQAVCQPRST